jgi:hypothetical protein
LYYNAFVHLQREIPRAAECTNRLIGRARAVNRGFRGGRSRRWANCPRALQRSCHLHLLPAWETPCLTPHNKVNGLWKNTVTNCHCL